MGRFELDQEGWKTTMIQEEAKQVADSPVQATDSAPDDSVVRRKSVSALTAMGHRSVKPATPAGIEAT
jgi:hypothetical protein